ncbi:hypothetical protein EG328_000154 [Venturia inaequalis]|uniref:dihydrolipoyllysine-residue succinyltransferase n=1 Tax=Venturia inaequalis TaxID=5025 RepID=A0A8H3VIB6_VENIN|nr:hypothetical protein EG328_000154 [Venturia inaequalis]KAE9994563.1 hypothetical protein EG327_008076 [Venturia inaequalis]RDI84113.1 Phosphatidylinositol 4-phosphate 5-kinase [Venturia inaequalis]
MLPRFLPVLRTAACLSSSRARQAALRQPIHQGWIRLASTTVKVPQMAESITEGTLKQFSKQVGDYVEQDEEIATIETDKIDVSVNAPEAGTIKEWLVSEEDTVTVGQDLVNIEVGAAPEGGASKEAKNEPKEPASKDQETASQPEGQQEKEASKPAPPKEESKPEPKSQPPPPPEKKATPPPQPKQDKSSPQKDEKGMPLPWNRDESRVKMNRMRLRIAERLKQAQNTAASLSTFQEVDMSALMAFRKKYKDEYLQKTGVKIGFMGAFAHACALAMKELPSINAGIEGANGGDTIVYHDYVDISVAVSTPKGLTTPVVRNVESMNILEIEKCISELGKKARDNKLTIEDLAGGTFTISNGGVFGSLMSTPIINPPQSAVIGLHAIFDRAVPINGKIEIRPMMNLTLTYDHRLIDGREAATFLVKVKEYIQDPARMLLA